MILFSHYQKINELWQQIKTGKVIEYSLLFESAIPIIFILVSLLGIFVFLVGTGKSQISFQKDELHYNQGRIYFAEFLHTTTQDFLINGFNEEWLQFNRSITI